MAVGSISDLLIRYRCEITNPRGRSSLKKKSRDPSEGKK